MTEVTGFKKRDHLYLNCIKKFLQINLIDMKNMGKVDRIIRVIIAVVIGVLFYTKVITGTAGIVLLVFAGVFLITSLVSTCPLYLPFGIKTCKTKQV